MEDLIYLALIARFKANEALFTADGLKPVAHFDLFKNQYIYPELHHLYKRPALFFEFNDEWEDKDDKSQDGTIMLSVHIELENYGDSADRSKNKDYALEIFKYHRYINALIHGFKSPVFTRLKRLRGQTDQNPTNTNVKVITYSTRVMDDSAWQLEQKGLIKEPLDDVTFTRVAHQPVEPTGNRYVIGD
ncbi:MAG: hypothetical protein RIE86_09215 [Imperialibacter sp.]|uniref:hypothetical protein n=1 Tax=Imperialibacter sp. TaxID=2038411 RepID=UPI0032EEF5F1